ncbi:MAG: prolipoprotein diacylglyceryl transferase [Thermodesulfobacteriota bacterium]
MLPYPQIDPVIFSFGPVQIRWYGLMYVLGFIATYLLIRKQIRLYNLKELKKHFDNLNTILIICLIIGGRLGYVFFYNPGYYLQHPMEILATWHGGMSFHGGLIALIVGGYIFCRLKKLDFLNITDSYIVTAPIGLGLGRLGNFINGELYGRITDQPWGMIFPGVNHYPRHPSQLYEALVEGLLLFIILWPMNRKKYEKNWPAGIIFVFFLILYGVFRFLVEFFRAPDAHIGLWGGLLSRGQILCLIMIGLGVFLWYIFIRRTQKSQTRDTIRE